ncbi:Ig-like domain-containing protein, partial [Synechococcus sp. AH-736-M02]|nr:Ig-like domain-containing protein [Synechococcus sp. AH-736-M02]
SKNIVLKRDFDTKVKDKISPTLTITGQTDEIINKDIIFEFSFTEDVFGFEASDIEVIGGSKGRFSGSGDRYELLVSPNSNEEGTVVIKTQSGIVADSAGNKIIEEHSARQDFDTKAPTFNITGHSENVINDDVTFKFNFSEDVVGFKASDIKVSGGSRGKLTGSGDSYQLVVSPNSNDEGTITIKTNPGIVSDLAGNQNTKKLTARQDFDTKAPTFDITGHSENVINDDVTFKFNFSEDVVGFKASDINVSGGSKVKFSGSGDSYQLVVSPNSNDEGTITIKTNAGVASDLAGNQNTKKLTARQDFDTKSPELSILSSSNSESNDDVTIEFLFSEDIEGFKFNDISITGGTAGEFSGSGGYYKLVVSPDEDTKGSIDIKVAKGAASDIAGNTNVAKSEYSHEYDTRENEGTRLPGLAKNFVSPLSPQLENTVVKGLNFGEIYSELVRAKRYPDGTFTADSFELMDVTIFDTILSPSEAGITVNKSGSIKIDTTGSAYEDLNDGEIVDVVATFKVTDDVDQFDFGTVTFQVLGVTD